MTTSVVRANHLYALRRNRSLGQKTVARLLGHGSPQMVSQYETGRTLPKLETAILLEIVLGANLSEIYVDLYQDLQLLVLKRAEAFPDAIRRDLVSRVLRKDLP